MLRIFAGLDSFSVSDDGMTANSGDSYLGDVDLNGKITAADARLTLRISAKLETL